MEKEFVPYELALKMKQLGYDGPCFGVYIAGHLMITYDSIYNSTDIPVVKAPTFSQAFRWFRENHNLRGFIGFRPNIKQFDSHIYDMSLSGKEYVKQRTMEEFNKDPKVGTYEEAELECLKKLIKIVKNKKNMKNVHVLPTEKPSRLMIDTIENKLYLQPILHEKTINVLPQNIYITSDEEIKEGVDQWYLDKFLNKPYNSGGSQYSSKQDVIILTTDQDLIADGVQTIDDEFLEWFVKNPSCEFVEAKHFGTCCGNQSITQCINCEKYNPIYKITIPQEEPKQETLNKINNMSEEIKKQINLLQEEQTRVKQFINENNFNCTTAPYVIAKQYRDEIKKHIKILKMNLEN